MEVKDEVVSWFIRNIMAPRILDITHPGFIILNSIQKSQEIYRRQFFLSEDMFADIESGFVRKYGKNGAQKLYAAGKKFGKTYAKVCHFPNISNSTEKELGAFSRTAIMFVGANWATKSQGMLIDPKNRKFRLRMWDYAVCSKNGIGYVLGSGGIAGIWAYMMGADDVEGVQTSCEGERGKFCEFYMAPKSVLKREGLDFIESDGRAAEADETDYAQINSIRATQYANISMNDLIDAGYFKFKNSRKATFQGSDYLPIEASVVGILETELAKIKGGDKLLFDICFEFGKRTGAGAGWNERFVKDYLSATGFGDIIIAKGEGKKYTVAANYFPWTTGGKNSFTMYRGLVSGLLSAVFGKKITFPKAECGLVGTDFSVTIESK